MLTPQQLKLLIFINDKIRESGGVPPSVSEMAGHMGHTSNGGVQGLLHNLETRGFIKRVKGRDRSVEVLRMPEFHEFNSDRCQRQLEIACQALIRISLGAGHSETTAADFSKLAVQAITEMANV